MTLTIVRDDGEPLDGRLQKLCDSIEDGVTVSLLPGGSAKALGEKPPAVKKRRAAHTLLPVAAGALLAVAGAVCSLSGAERAGAALLTAAAAVCAFKPAVRGITGAARLEIDEDLLVSVAVAAAIAIGDCAEAAAVALLFSLGRSIEAAATRRSRAQIEQLSEIRPDTVHTDSGDRPASEAKPGDIIVVRAGERIPLDGEIVGGSGSVDPSAVTGESVPISAEYGVTVLGGMLNGSGVLRIKVTGDYENSAAARILKLVEQSAERKGAAERFITRFARVYTPACILAAALITVIPWMISGAFSALWLRRALVFLVTACPCALVISVPLAFFAGVGAASRSGVLIKGGVYIERLAGAKAVCLDKTGTLTSGRLSVERVVSLEGDALAIAAAAEAHSDHPVALAVRAACERPARIEGDVTELAGYGVEINGERRISVGSRRLMERGGVDLSALPEAQVYVAVDGRGVGCISVADRVRQDAPALVDGLRRRGISRIALLSGDAPSSVSDAAARCGITESYPSLLPHQKVELVERITSESGDAVFVGDGINDAPALAAASVGAAMGLGTDAAIETADLVLTGGSVSSLLDAVDISRRTMRVVRANVALSLSVKLAVMISAFFVPMMWAAVAADVVLSVVCSINSAGILARSKPRDKL